MSKQKCNLNVYFQVHQPRRLRAINFLEIGNADSIFDDALNKSIMRKVAKNCYQPVNLMLLKLIHKHPTVRITFSISGEALEQMEKYCPVVLESFRMLAATKAVEFLGETYNHSLCSLTDTQEFKYQVNKHTATMFRLLGVQPTVFRNTELVYSDELGQLIHQLGFKGVYIDGVEKVLGKKSPDVLYHYPGVTDFTLFLRNYRLSDDIAFRFSDKAWAEYPLTVQKFVDWLVQQDLPKENMLTLGMDYETFGEHQKSSTGVLNFFQELLTATASHKQINMINPTEAARVIRVRESLSVPVPISWADKEKDLSAWLGNEMQQDAFNSVNKLKKDMATFSGTELIATWRHLQTSDHFYYMSTKGGDDENVHSYFSPYPSYEAFMNYMNVLADLQFRIRLDRKKLKQKKQHVIMGTPVLMINRG